MKTKEQTVPKWFKGSIYEQGETVINPFSNEEYELNGLELSMYDFIMGANQLMEMGMYAPKTLDDMRKGLTWFRKNNVEAYYVLLD